MIRALGPFLFVLTVTAALTARADAATAIRLAPTPDALHRERTAALEQRVTRLLRALPNVEHVEVQLSLPAPFAEPLDAPLPEPRASVVLVRRTSAPLDVFPLLQGTVPNLTRQRVTLIDRTTGPTPTPAFVQLGPFRVHPSSAPTLRIWLTVSLLANALLAGIVLSRLPGKSPPQRKVDPRARRMIPP